MATPEPMPIPPGLKPVTMYVRRAEKLDKAPEPEAPVVAYHCRLHATEQAMKLQDNTEEGKGFLLAMIGRLEEDKQRGMAQFSQEEGKKLTTDWAMKEFNGADEEDRAGLADQGTARSFYAAGVFFDVLRQFGNPDEEMDRRRIYCKWKASQILKAIKEGKTPTPGGAGEDVVTGMPSMGGGGVGGEPAALSAMPSASGGGGGGGEPPQNDPLAGMIPEAPTDNPSYTPPHADAAPATTPQGTSMPPASAPSSAPSPQQYNPHVAPAGPKNTTYPGGPAAAASAPSPYARPGPPAPASAPYVAPPAPYVAPYVAPVAPAPAPAPTRPRYDPSARPKTPVPSASGSRRSGGSRPMEGNMADAMEHCRFALRALEKKDVDVAVQKLHEALQQLT